MDPGLLLLAGVTAGATALLRVFRKPSKEGFDAVPANNYPATVTTGQQLYNNLTLSSDPRVQAVELSRLPIEQQNAMAGAVNAALTPTDVDISDPNNPVAGRGVNINPMYVPNDNSIMLKSAYCENMKITDSVFNDTQFNRDCGVCLSGGTTNSGTAFTEKKGLYIDPQAKMDMISARDAAGSPYTNAKPSTGSCTGATGGVGNQYSFAITSDELKNFSRRHDCAQNKTLDGNCAVCLQDGSYTYVDSGNMAVVDVVTFYVAGLGTMSVSVGGKTISFGKSTVVQLSTTPVSFKAQLKEDSFMNFTIAAPDDMTPAEFYGVVEIPLQTGGVSQIPLDKLLLNDDQLGGKPRRATDFPTVQTPNGTARCAHLMSGFSKESMILTGSFPFLLPSTFPFKGVDCRGSILQGKPSSASIYGADPCYKPAGQGPGTWSDACLKDRILNSGCTTQGDLYKDPSSLQSLSLADLQKQLDVVSQNQYSDPVASKKCNGRDISSPCDQYVNFDVNYTPDISPQCIKFLYYNGGAGNQNIGPTYTGPTNTYYSLDSKGNKIYCLPGAGYDPDKNTRMVRDLQRNSRTGAGTGRIGIPYIQDFFNKAYQRATNTGLNANLPDSQGGRADSVGQCFATLAAVPVSIVPATTMPNARYVRLSNAYQCLQISQIACYDNQGNNQAFGKPTSYSTTYGYGSKANYAVDGTMRARSFPQIFHSGCQANDYFMVDMSAVYPIKQIVYYNRADCCQNRATGIVVELLDANKQVVWSTTLQGNQMSESVLTFAKPYNI